jgi:hypothetical protein
MDAVKGDKRMRDYTYSDWKRAEKEYLLKKEMDRFNSAVSFNGDKIVLVIALICVGSVALVHLWGFFFHG